MRFTHKDGDTAKSHTIRAIIDSDEPRNALAIEACIDAILHGSGTGDQVELYTQAFRDHGDEYRLFTETAGIYVRDALLDDLAVHEDGKSHPFWGLLLRDLLDLGNRALWADIADSYMPDPEAVALAAADTQED